MSLPSSSLTEVTVLLPEHLAKRNLPVNFNPNDLNLFSHELERVIPPARLLEYHNVSVSADGILFQRGKMLPVSFAFPHTRASWKRRSVLKFFINNYLIKKRRRFEKESVWVIDDWSAGYFHWLADVLPRLFTIKERLPDLVLLLPLKYKDLEFVQASLEPFKIGRVEYIDPGEVLVCSSLIVPTQTAPSGNYNDQLIREVRNLLVGSYSGQAAATRGDRIFISRSMAPKRRIANEAEVLDVLQEFGFQIIHAENHSFAEQVRIASSARYLVSNHGAGLMNMLFMNSGSSVHELRHFTDRINNCYFTLASALELSYFYQTCLPRNANEDPHSADLLVNTEALRKNIELMLNSQVTRSLTALERPRE